MPEQRDGSVRALVIEDDDAVRQAIRRSLLLSGYEVITASDGEEGLLALAETIPDVVVLDLGLPKLDGLEVCRRLRAIGDRTPVLMLTARDAVEERVAGLEAGADDYLVKPYDVRELRARLAAIMRRHLPEAEGRALRLGELELDADAHAARLGEREIELTRTEYQLLELFMLNPRRVLRTELVYERIWGHDISVTSNSLRVYIGYLRRKLEAGGEPRLLHTVHGVGYVLREQ
jgi:two-component system response regulator MprA